MEGKLEGTTMNKDISADLDVALGTKIFFAHQSVGNNLLSGVQRLAAGAGRELKVAKLDEADGKPGALWLHIAAGRNGEPKSKIDEFVSTLKGRTSLKPDVAFMKFCYIDFNPQTDVGDVFAYYQNALNALKRERPDVRIAHVTAPLMQKPNTLKARAQRLLGREVWGDAANVKRAEFNARLLAAFPSDPIFDVARWESTRPDGSRESFEQGGKTYYSLVPSYSDDGGHLDDLGQRVLGAEMIRFVARAMKQPLAGPALQ